MRLAPVVVVLLILPTVVGEGGGINSEFDLSDVVMVMEFLIVISTEG